MANEPNHPTWRDPLRIATIIIRSLMGLLFLFASITYLFKLITPPPLPRRDKGIQRWPGCFRLPHAYGQDYRVALRTRLCLRTIRTVSHDSDLADHREYRPCPRLHGAGRPTGSAIPGVR